MGTSSEGKEGLSLFFAALLPKPAGWFLRAASHDCTGLPKARTGSKFQTRLHLCLETRQLKAHDGCLGYHYKHQAAFLLGVSFPVQFFQRYTPQAFAVALCTTGGRGVRPTPLGRAFSPSSLRLTFCLAFPHLPVFWVPSWNTHQFSEKLMQNGAAYWKTTTRRDFVHHGCFFCLHKGPSLGAFLVLLGRQDFHLISWKNAASAKISTMMNNTTKTTSSHIL